MEPGRPGPDPVPEWDAVEGDRGAVGWVETGPGLVRQGTASARTAERGSPIGLGPPVIRPSARSAAQRWSVSETVGRFRWEGEAEEDVLRLLLEHAGDGTPVPERSLQEGLGLSRSGFAPLISRLKEKGWLRKDGAELSLTPVGVEVARDLLDRHRTAERFFNEILGEPPSFAHAAAERLEHVISRRALEKLKESLERARGAAPLADLSPGEGGTIVAVKGPGGREFSRLIGIGISPGSRIEVSNRLPNGAVIVQIDGGKAAVAEEIARSIFVRKGPLDEDGYPRRPTELG